MGAAKDMWIDEVERVGEDYAAERLTHEEAVKKLTRLGLDAGEASDMLAEVVS